MPNQLIVLLASGQSEFLRQSLLLTFQRKEAQRADEG